MAELTEETARELIRAVKDLPALLEEEKNRRDKRRKAIVIESVSFFDSGDENTPSGISPSLSDGEGIVLEGYAKDGSKAKLVINWGEEVEVKCKSALISFACEEK